MPLGIFNLLAQTRGVHKTPQLLVQLHQGVNWVNGGTRDIVNDRAFLASNLVEQGRLAHIRLAHQSNATWTSGNGSTARLFRESAQNLIQNVSASSTMQSRNGPRITQAERVERGHIGVHGIRIKFIRYQDHRHFGALQFARHNRVSLRNADIGIDDENDDIGCFHCHFSLTRNSAVNTLGIRIPTTSVLDEKALSVPVSDIRDAVASNARVVFHDSLTAA